MSTNEVVKSVAKEFKYYIQIKRREDGFDLSDVNQPVQTYPPLKPRPAHQYSVLHDRSLKHYFRQPEVKARLTHLKPFMSKVDDKLHDWREIEIRKKLNKYMKNYNFKNNLQCSSSCNVYSPRLQASGDEYRRRKNRCMLSVGLPALRTVPDKYITKAEKNRLLNSATKIICGSELNNIFGKPSLYYGTRTPSSMKFFQTILSRPITSAVTRNSGNKINKESNRRLKYRPRSPTPPSSDSSRSSTPTSKSSRASKPSTTSTRSIAGSYSSSASPVPHSSSSASSRSCLSKTSSKSPVMPEGKMDNDAGVTTATQTAQDAASICEVTEGPECEYEVRVWTANRIGASTTATIKLTLFGEKGKSRELELNRISKIHKIPFQKGNEDLFILSAPYVGRLEKIQIGHDRAELKYAWYLDKVSVLDTHAERIYQFPCDNWLSGEGGDNKTYRFLLPDSEREFTQAVKDRITKSAQDRKNDGSNETKDSNDDRADKMAGVQRNDNTTSDSPRISTIVRVESETLRQKMQREQKDDYQQMPTKVILNSMPGSKVVDEINLDNDSSTDAK